ncbi:hypothetical protein GCHA_1107 [Paraglaciecola chathamensis S18K6]|uniref:Uncharacterized protein n=2 Tax=Paraglaciecola chathamensis TaxID=368405 RepID=A0ABQ0IE21_9ALTE|nr:hypothetical protein GAGA_4449 [Paraglaciecola agarilytica NO2]GAC09069.1 hypothetical protein GCHA_1107 [Paraglaciecola chathamensis S18K6]
MGIEDFILVPFPAASITTEKAILYPVFKLMRGILPMQHKTTSA